MSSGDLSLLTASLRCARVARAHGYLPGGTAASAAVFVMVEVPLPWPHDVGSHPLVEPLAPVLQAHGGRLQAIVPNERNGSGTRVVVQRQPEGPFVAYERAERVVPTARLVDEVEALLAEPPPAVEDEPVVDVLVCTHGSRDVCCGADGMRLFNELAGHWPSSPVRMPGIRLWRTSHTGGHRFAPTAVTFPDGRAWAWLDAGLVRGIVDRTLQAADAAAHDRGGVAFDDPFVQVADGAVFGAVGWQWLDTPRHATVEGTDGVRLVTLHAAAGPAYRVEVGVRRVVPVPDCGHPLDEARKSSPELEIRDISRL